LGDEHGVDADVRHDIVLQVTTAAGISNFGMCADFHPQLCDAPDNGYIPAGAYTAGMDFKSCFTWNNNLPADGITTVQTVTVRLGGKGTVYIEALQLANSDALVLFHDGVSKSETTPTETPDDDIRPEEPVVLLGDVTENGSVGSEDVRILLKFSAGSLDLTTPQLVAADYNEDGMITTIDVREILQTLLL